MAIVGNDTLIGYILICVSISFALYYTFWTVGLPLLEPDFFAHQYFPDVVYAAGIPLTVLSLLVTGLSAYAFWLMNFE